MKFLFVMAGENRAAILQQGRAARHRAAVTVEMAQVCVAYNTEIREESQRIREAARQIRQEIEAQRAANEARCVPIRPAFG